MIIADFYKGERKNEEGVTEKIEYLMVVMSQEEYQIAAQAILNAKDKGVKIECHY